MADEIAQRDQNRAIATQGVSSLDGNSTITLRVDPVTKRLLVETSDSENVSSSTVSSKVSVGSSSTSVISSNDSRGELILVNDSDEVIYINLSGTAVMNEGIRLNANGGTFSNKTYTGQVTAICASGSKNLTVTEL